MAFTHANVNDAFSPQDYGKLVDLAVKAQSIAARSATYVATDKEAIVFPKWTADPVVAWYAELAELTPTDGTTSGVTVTPKKVAGIHRESLEIFEDSDPTTGALIGKGLANSAALGLDAAYLGNTTEDGPSGLLSTAYTTVDTGASMANLDPFISARFAAEAAGSELTHWIVKPAVAEALSKLKTATGSNQTLIQFVSDGITIAGLPVLRSNQIDADTLFWGIPKEHVVLVVRKGTTVEKFPAVYNVGVDIRVHARYGIGFLNPAGVVRGYNAA